MVSFLCEEYKIPNSSHNLRRTTDLVSLFVKDVSQASLGQPHKNVGIIASINEEEQEEQEVHCDKQS